MRWTRPDVQARHPRHVQPCRPPIQRLLSTSTVVSPARARARAAALRHAARHGSLPTVSALAAAADVSRGTAATVLKPLRGYPLPPG